MRKGAIVAALAVATVVAAQTERGAQLTLAFEDRFDPSPSQVKLGMEIAGLALGIAISWTRDRPTLAM
ncbi:hypothetical protein [Glacieibacterium frigidum]|uniref:Uncharacterized protein n=1 Tax=Glacieibacterium frigidum TaxID=2593303 RepID=A0A552UGU9_9SPHN|nr:hypothetical protein [Glacieibacterium frigidum]TRW17448.1 hypothetical protein FMM06_04595 [Glacieibacterium frigidum]